MHQFKAILSAIIKSSYRFDKKSKGFYVGAVAAAVFLAVLFGGMLAGGVYFMSGAFLQAGLEAELLTLIFSGAQAVVLVFGTAAMVSTIFFNRDAEFLLSLPVKSSTVFFAKLFYVYVSELVISAFVVLCSGIALGVAAGYGAGFYIMLLPAILILPLFPLLISSLLSLPIMYAVSFFKRKGALAGIALALLFAGGMALYLSFAGGLMELEEGGELVFRLSQKSIDTIRAAARILLPNIALAHVMLGTDILLNASVLLASYAALGALAFAVSSAVYRRGVSMQLEQNKSVRLGKFEYRVRTLRGTLIKKDWLELVRHPYLAFYCLFQVVFAPLLLMFYQFVQTSASAQDQEALAAAGFIDIFGVAITFFTVGLLTASMNYTALSSITREGKNYSILKTLPIFYRAQLSAKAALASIIGALSVSVGMIAALFIFPGQTGQLLLLWGFLLIMGNGLSYYFTGLDVKRPKLIYESISHALKNNVNSFIAMGVSSAILLPSLGLYIAAHVLSAMFTPLYVFSALWVLLYAAAVGLNLLFRHALQKNAEKKMAAIEV